MTERARYWRRQLDRWERSGLSQAAYCRRHGLKAVTFSWWKRKLAAEVIHPREPRAKARRTSANLPRAEFVEVEVSGAAAMGSYEVLLSHGRAIRLPADFDPQKVAQLITAVETAC